MRILKIFYIRRRTHRRNASVGGTFQAVREGSLFEYFLVVGVTSNTVRQNPGATTFAPEIVYKFPHQEDLGFEVTHFCFPDGVKTRGKKA